MTVEHSEPTTAGRTVAAGHRRIVIQGYSGFSFADLATDVGIRKPGIHHHFPSKSDLAVAVIARSRARIEAEAAALHEAADARRAVCDYARYWERCIADGSDPFCLAGVLAAEMPNLPAPVAEAVRAHSPLSKRGLRPPSSSARDRSGSASLKRRSGTPNASWPPFTAPCSSPASSRTRPGSSVWSRPRCTTS